MIGPNAKAKGGIATVINNFQSNCSFKNHKFIYISSWEDGNKLLVVKSFIKSFVHFVKQTKKRNVDIAHIHVAQKGSFFRKAIFAKYARSKGIKVIFHIHASQFDLFYHNGSSRLKRMIKSVLNNVDEIVVLSDEWHDFFKNITNTPISIFENAVSIPDKNNYNIESKNIVTFGRLGKRKGSYDTLEIAKIVQTVYPDIQFILYGDGEVEQLNKLIRSEKLTNVRLGGWIGKNEQQQIFQNTALHLLPSYHEGLPMAILETMANGIPNLSTNVGGIPQAIKNKKNGFLVHPGDYKVMASIIIDFFENKSKRKQFSKESYLMIKEKFSIDSYIKKWENFYDKLAQ